MQNIAFQKLPDTGVQVVLLCAFSQKKGQQPLLSYIYVWMGTSLTSLPSAGSSFLSGEMTASIPLYFHMIAKTKGFNANKIISFHFLELLNGCFEHLKSKTFLLWLRRPCAMGLCQLGSWSNSLDSRPRADLSIYLSIYLVFIYLF